MCPERGLTHIIQRDGDIVPFDPKRIVTAIYKASAAIGAHDRAAAESLAQEVVQRLQASAGTPSVEEIQDLVERVLIEHNQPEIAKAYILYREDRARLRRRTRAQPRARDLLPYKVMWRTLVWNVDHDCHTLAGLNRHIRNRTFAGLVQAAEAAQETAIEEVSQAIVSSRSDGGGVRVVIVAGPSSSGKTTTTAKISRQLESEGLTVVPINLDNYFHDLHLHPQDESGDYDFETPEALDLKLINEHLAALLAGQEVRLPEYDFKQGRRFKDRHPLRIGRRDIIVLDTLHGLYGGLTESVPDALKFRLYIEPVLQLRDAAQRWVRWTDLRLLRRMMRDAAHRNYEPASTIAHWHYVRRGELKHIIPHTGTADFVLNGALAYELPIFKRHLAQHFPGFIERWRNDARRVDAFVRAQRIQAVFKQLDSADDRDVPATSVLREFIGGSAYDVH